MTGRPPSGSRPCASSPAVPPSPSDGAGAGPSSGGGDDDPAQDVALSVQAHLRTLLNDIDAGVLACSAAFRHRIEGAVIALECVEGGDPTEIVKRLNHDRLRDSGG